MLGLSQLAKNSGLFEKAKVCHSEEQSDEESL